MKIVIFVLGVLVTVHALPPKDQYPKTIREKAAHLMDRVGQAVVVMQESVSLEYESFDSFYKNVTQVAATVINSNEALKAIKERIDYDTAKGIDRSGIRTIFETGLCEITDEFEEKTIKEIERGRSLLNISIEALQDEIEAISETLNPDNVHEVVKECQLHPLKCPIDDPRFNNRVRTMDKLVRSLNGASRRIKREVDPTLQLLASDIILKKIVIPIAKYRED